MKKQFLILAAALCFMAAGTSSCKSHKCYGGGWYNNRNTDYTPAGKTTNCDLVNEKQEADDNAATP